MSEAYECSACGRTTLTGLTLRPSGKTLDRHTTTPDGGEVCKDGKPEPMTEKPVVLAAKLSRSKMACPECGEIHPILKSQGKVRKHTNPHTLTVCQQRADLAEVCVTCQRSDISIRLGKYAIHKDLARNTRCPASNKTVKEAMALKVEPIARPAKVPRPRSEEAATYRALSGLGRSQLKAKRLFEEIKPNGWRAKYEEDEQTGTVTLVATRGTGQHKETMQISWFNGACIGGDGKITHEYRGRIIAVRNASAVKQRAALSPETVEQEHLKVANRKTAPRAQRVKKTADDLKMLLPFDPAKASDKEILEAITGRTISWENSMSKKVMTGVAKKPKIVKSPKGRQITFTGPTGTSTVRIESIVSVG